MTTGEAMKDTTSAQAPNPPFPYVQLFGIVCASLAVTTVIFWVWHVVDMRALKTAHEKENDTLRGEIAVLSQQLSVVGSSTSKK
jgi:hypothetical protein